MTSDRSAETCAVIISYESPDKVFSCVDALSQQVGEIIIVDNSADPSVENAFRRLFSSARLHFIFNGTNAGLGAALNQGLKYSLAGGYQWTLLLDQDSRPSPDMISEMFRSYENLGREEQAATALVTPVVHDTKSGEMLPSIITTRFVNRKIRKPDRDCFVHFHITSGTLLKNKALSGTGFMNERFFIDYIDFDFCFRSLTCGYKILLSRNALLHHALGERKEVLGFHFREHNQVRVYYQTRNRLLAMFKHGKKFRSFFYAEACRSTGKLFKIILLESDKRDKLKMYIKGVRDFVREYKKKPL